MCAMTHSILELRKFVIYERVTFVVMEDIQHSAIT